MCTKKSIMPTVRRLRVDDFKKGVIDLLNQLRPMPGRYTSDASLFQNVYDAIETDPRTHTFVIEKEGVIVATISLVCIPKFIYGGRCLGQIEDLVVDRKNRNKGLGSQLVKHCVNYATKDLGCFKVALCARPSANSFYSKLGFKCIGQYYAMYSDIRSPDPAGSPTASDEIRRPAAEYSQKAVARKVRGTARIPKNYFD